MRHNVDGRKLGRTAAHRKALYRNLVIALITHERIRTTTPKAKEARRLAERMITFAKRGDLHARRHVASILGDKNAVRKLFDELGPRYADRQGGYTRVLKLSGLRKGDAAEMAMLEFVRDGDRPKKKRSARKASSKPQAKTSRKKKESAAAPVEEQPVEVEETTQQAAAEEAVEETAEGSEAAAEATVESAEAAEETAGEDAASAPASSDEEAVEPDSEPDDSKEKDA